jgi:hypothetical protein
MVLRAALGKCALVVVLAMSVALNVGMTRSALLGRPPQARQPAEDRAPFPEAAENVAAAARAPAVRPLRPAEARRDACLRQNAELSRSIRALDISLDALFTPKQRFQELQRSRDDHLADQLRRHLTFRTDAGAVGIECRGTVCRASMSTGGLVSASVDREWARDNLRGIMGAGDGTYYDLRPEDMASGFAILREFVQRFLSAGAFERCRAPSSGTLDIELRLNPEDDLVPTGPVGLSFESTGALIGTETAECVVDALRRSVAETQLPSRYTHATLRFRWPNPPDGGPYSSRF